MLLAKLYVCIFFSLCAFFIKAHTLFALKSQMDLKAFLALFHFGNIAPASSNAPRADKIRAESDEICAFIGA